jgi:glycosyltransferase involved in cell wall biosynthesis
MNRMPNLPTPELSVVIPLYNQGGTIRRALDSALRQTRAELEIVVVDDGSTDDGPQVVASVADGRIRQLRQPNRGVSCARNAGIEASRAPVVAFLDGDDEWLPRHAETLLRLRSAHAACDVFATGYRLGRSDGTTRVPVIRGLSPVWEGELDRYFELASRSDPLFGSSTVAVTRRALDAVGRFPAGIESGEDLLTWARLAARFGIAYNREPTAIFWQNPGHTYRAAPTRQPDPANAVGKALEALLASCPPGRRAGLRAYLSHWHKMRASIYMRLGMRSDSLREIGRGLRHNGRSWKLYAYALLLAAPASW